MFDTIITKNKKDFLKNIQKLYEDNYPTAGKTKEENPFFVYYA